MAHQKAKKHPIKGTCKKLSDLTREDIFGLPFRLIWSGSVVEHAGEFMEVAAILWLTNELTHSPLWLTIVGSCRFITMIFFPVIGGVVADRVNGRGLLIAALMGSALLSGILAVPISLAVAGGICLFVSLLLILLFPRFRGTG